MGIASGRGRAMETPQRNPAMPNYDYLCESCGHRFEVFQSMNDPKLVDCPQDDCEGKVRRLLGTGAGLIFKGGGFYQTDYRSSSYKEAAKKDQASSKSGGCGDSCGCKPGGSAAN